MVKVFEILFSTKNCPDCEFVKTRQYFEVNTDYYRCKLLEDNERNYGTELCGFLDKYGCPIAKNKEVENDKP